MSSRVAATHRDVSGRSRLGAALLVAAIVTVVAGADLRAHDLPLGDGHVTERPERGNVFSCRATFRGGGARHEGPWFHGDTWDPTEKPHVRGRVMWPEASFTLTAGEDALAFTGDGLPVEQPTGTFPIAPDDPAFAYDTNPNRIAAQHLAFRIPKQPALAAAPACLPMGMIGFTTTGVAFYNALDDAGRDAAAHEIQDLCDGHPQASSQYHYHSATPCLPGVDTGGVVGWALDGFPILGKRDASGRALSNADLDACHGRAETVVVDGRTYGYAYHLTDEYPYTLGCFSGEVLDSTLRDVRGALQPPGPGARGRGRGRGQPPPR